MINPRFISETVPPFVWVLRRAAAPGETNAEFLKDGQSAGDNRIAGIGRSGRTWDAMLFATRVDRFYLLAQLRQSSIRNAQMISRVVAELKSALIQFTDLIPGHVILLIGGKRKTFADEESRAEPVTLQDGTDHAVMRRDRVVKGQHGQFVRDRLERADRNCAK